MGGESSVLVHKFGGEIMNNPHYLRRAADIIKNNRNSANVVVVSALRGITDSISEKTKYFADNGSEEEIDNYLDKLKQIHYGRAEEIKESKPVRDKIDEGIDQLGKYFQGIVLLKEINPRVKDRALVYGERLSSEIFYGYLLEKDIESETLTGGEIGITTDDNYGDAQVIWNSTRGKIKKSLKPLFEEKITPIVTGFDGKTIEGDTTTLGRGGSDTTACVIGRDLNAEEINLYKTTKGVTTADPEIVGKSAKTVPFLNYSEAMEAGKIIHRKGVEQARKGNIPIIVRYILDPEIKTIIDGNRDENKSIKMITYETNCYIIKVQDSKMAEELGHQGIITGLIAKNNINLKLTRDSLNGLVFVSDGYTREEDIYSLKKELEGKYSSVEIIPQMAIIRAIGNLGFDGYKSSQFNKIIYKNIDEGAMCIGSYPYTKACSLDGVIPDTGVKEVVYEMHEKLINK